MHKDQRELVRHLFAEATKLAEFAHEAAAEGQLVHIKPARYSKVASSLREAATELVTMANAVLIIARGDRAEGRSKPTKRTRKKRSTSC